MARRKQTRKIRIELRKNQQSRDRLTDLTRDYASERLDDDDLIAAERVSGKGDLTRKRTIKSDTVDTPEGSVEQPQLAVDLAVCRPGRVVHAVGLNCTVIDDAGRQYACATRRLLKSLSTDQRHVVVTGDRVLFRTVNEKEGMIERIEPRRGILSRTSRGREHVLAANVDQILIVASATEPDFKPNLIDRFLISAEKGKIDPIICINKVDLIDPANLQPVLGVYAQMGYRIHLVSAHSGFGIGPLRDAFRGRQTVVAGQSGVGKSSLLNAIEDGLSLRIGRVSYDNNKGRHTTTSAVLLPLDTLGGYVVDTPGIRQFELWDLIPAEVASYFRDLRPFANLCKFPNCTHTHEAECGVKDAVADNFLDARRYESYLHLFEGDG